MLKIKCDDHPIMYLYGSDKTRRNYTFTYSSTFFNSFSNSFARDLTKIGQSVFLADRAFKRSNKLGNRTRNFHVRIKVENADKWDSLRWLISRITNFVTQDNWQFSFDGTNNKQKLRIRQQNNIIHDSVSLFSDGLDSLCGAASLLKSKKNPIFVSHSPPSLTSAQTRIIDIKKRFSIDGIIEDFVNFNFRVKDINADGKKNLFPERSRRSRPFLYLSMAGAVAIEFEVQTIYLNENGPLAINLPIKKSNTGFQISRHAHPYVLLQFKNLLNSLGGMKDSIDVLNLFYNQTKGEELMSLNPHFDLAFDTISCEYARQQIARLKSWNRNKNIFSYNLKECGLCTPCLIRRAGFHTCGVKEASGHYAYSSISSNTKKKKSSEYPLLELLKNNPIDLYIFAKHIKDVSFLNFALDFSYDLSTIFPTTKDDNSELRMIYRLYKRFATQMINFLEDEVL